MPPPKKKRRHGPKKGPGGPSNAGRPVHLTGGRKITLYLDALTIARARVLGSGNVSHGIRSAVTMVAIVADTDDYLPAP